MLTVGTPQSRSLEVRLSRDRAILTLVLRGRLDMSTSGHVWREALRILERVRPIGMVIDAAEVSYCDGAGVALIVKLQEHMAHLDQEVSIHGLPVKFRSLLDIYGQASREPVPEPVRAPLSVVEQVGHAGLGIWQDLRILVTFVGELSVGLLDAAMHPHRIRWKEAWLTAERAGVNALPIIGLIGFLLGLIMAFQAAIPMRQFGAEIFVANLIGLSMLRELGPLITAILLAGRSASAFAAELGTMKVRERSMPSPRWDSIRFDFSPCHGSLPPSR
jgi:phospholipid/cholesterol/gamma-HCH transport system permease protein